MDSVNTLPPLPDAIGVLDIGSTHIGWAYWRFSADGENQITSGYVDLKALVATEDPWSRVNAFAFWLTDWLRERPCNVLVVEEPFSPMATGSQALRLLNGVYAICRLAALRLRIEFRDVTRTEAVKHLLGWASKRNPETGKMQGATKEQVLEKVREVYGPHVTSWDEADALATMGLILSELMGNGRLRPTKAEIATVKRAHKAKVRAKKKMREAVAAKSPPLPEILDGKRTDIPKQPAAQRKAELARKTPAAVAWPGMNRGVVARGRQRVN